MESVAITGHTSGIGKAIADLFAARDFRVIGFSRSNGYDLSDASTVPRIAEAVADCRYLINNAHFGFAQTDLLYAVFNRWKNLDRVIVNLGSESSDGIKNHVHPYAVQKAALDRACEQLNKNAGAVCRVTNIRPGWVDTPRVAGMTGKDPVLNAADVAETVWWALHLPKGVHVSQINLAAR